jgi:hypothetical protein
MIDFVYRDLVLVLLDNPLEEGGYIRPPGTDEEEILSGIVDKMGPLVIDTSIGDRVAFQPFDYRVQVIEDVRYAIMVQDNLICKLKEDE